MDQTLTWVLDELLAEHRRTWVSEGRGEDANVDGLATAMLGAREALTLNLHLRRRDCGQPWTVATWLSQPEAAREWAPRACCSDTRVYNLVQARCEETLTLVKMSLGTSRCCT